MRLINVHNRRLQEFYDAEVPPYAILSHTWSDDEVTFEDTINNRGQDKDAYRKIRFLCNQALADRLEWAWLDTICINKDSSAELSEAINSMYRWYHNAECCYAYLYDLPPEIEWDEQLRRPINDSHGVALQYAMSKSRWFTRGWTLQELLAPRNAKFYGKAWNFVGNRDDLAPLMAVITKIREPVLRFPHSAEGVQKCSVAEKMSWAANRETSRIEDKAYCLLGIFQVNMPMLYGEGARAFLRLQEEIIKSTDDHSLFVWQPQTAAERFLLLAPSPAHFAHGALIVSIPQLHHMDGHTLGNTGLRITLPLVYTGIDDYWHAILGCRYRDDYQNIIALCLKSRVRSSRAPKTLFVSPTIAHSQRYVVQQAPAKNSDLPDWANVIITRDLPKAEEQKKRADGKYWFSLGDSKEFSIIAAYPQECFNSQTLVMDLARSQEQYGAVLVSMAETAAKSAEFDDDSWYSRSLAIVFGAWNPPGSAADANEMSVGLFGVVQSNPKNLSNACRFAVSRSIYRTKEASQQHVAWVRGVYNVPWGRSHHLNVSFMGDREIGILNEVVNVITLTLQPAHENRAQPMHVLKQSKEPDGNPLGVERLQDVVRSETERDMSDKATATASDLPDPNAVYELEDDSWRVHAPEDSESDGEYYFE